MSSESPRVRLLQQRLRNTEARNVTCGSWESEPEAEDYFVQFARQTGLFTVYRQVWGRPVHQPHFRDHEKSSTKLRADIILVPNKKLIDEGWDGGIVLIEVKKSGEKIGRGLSQVQDYMNAVWQIQGGISIVPTFGFLFPALQQANALASILAHQHIGTASINDDRLLLACGAVRVISIWLNGRIKLGRTDFGRKTGSK